MPSCSARNCSNRSGDSEHFHKFPSDPQLREIWIAAVNRPDHKFTSNAYLCHVSVSTKKQRDFLWSLPLLFCPPQTLWETGIHQRVNTQRQTRGKLWKLKSLACLYMKSLKFSTVCVIDENSLSVWTARATVNRLDHTPRARDAIEMWVEELKYNHDFPATSPQASRLKITTIF